MPSIYEPAEDSYLMQEALKSELPQLINKNPNTIFFEIGCGSGINLQTALSLGVKKENIFSCDINSSAVAHCKKLGFNSTKSDLFKNIKGKFDLIIFNPPYLPEDTEEPEDSKLATTGGKKGSEIINSFLVQAKNYLTENGKILLLSSSLTKGINFNGFVKKTIARKKLFFEELVVNELKTDKLNSKNLYIL